jgi:hypothetical protein
LREFHLRTLKDRRKQPTPAISRFTLWGRRRAFRRKEDRERDGYVDQYSSGLFLLLILLVGSSILDALFTMIILDFGGWGVIRVVDSVILMLWRQMLIGEIFYRLCLFNATVSGQ